MTSGAPYPYGFGWELLERNGQPLHQHTGVWQGFRTAYSRFLGDSLSIIVLANSTNGNPSAFVEGIAAIANPALAVPPLEPIPDTEPEVTARLTALLEQVRAGTLNPAEFAYVPEWFWPVGVPGYQAWLQQLGPAGPLVLAKRELLGDDRVYTYLVEFGPVTLRYVVSIIPDGRVSSLQLLRN